MKSRRLGVFTLLAHMVLAGSAYAAQFQGLGFLHTGNVRSQALGISADGTTVVGTSELRSPDNAHTLGMEAFRWSASGGMLSLGRGASGSNIAQAHAADADGSVIVGNHFPDYAWQAEAVRWNNGTMLALGDHDGSPVSDSRIYDVSANGFVLVGGSYGFPVRWSPLTGWTNLNPGGPSGGLGTAARGVSADGDVIVGQAQTLNGTVAFRWTEATGLEPISGAGIAGAQAVSADGDVITGYAHNGGYNPFRWTKDTGLVFLSNRGGINIGRGVSADGQTIVGELDLTYSANGAFLWTAAGGLVELKPYLQSLGVDLTGWELDQANAVSDDGLTIVGTGRNPDGRFEAWVAIIPEPSVLCSLFLAATWGAQSRRISRRSSSTITRRSPMGRSSSK